MSHPQSNGEPDRRPIMVGETWVNPVNGEYAKIIELPWQNKEGRVVAELRARVGARVAMEHVHPALVECFTPLEGQLSVKLNGKSGVVREGETATIEPGVWHEWWNATDKDIRVRVEITPGERFVQMIETFFGLARLGHTDSKGMPNMLQLSLTAQEFKDVVVFRSPPSVVQSIVFGCLAPIARMRGYQATYPQLSRSTLAPRL
jgi:quercetin dioxygenase-like cupin family protein